ncbi:hypothetical protein EVAR_47509_1 [Eumeta japonica]|uniref:Uncharacterized protein n=1 Tax=Eumeta variegata TaxID=151549 RepID=A0A4C1XUX4_EUMVA|nr:hypothetical protein EVAR_47509_1 [Eumeta japonica]
MRVSIWTQTAFDLRLGELAKPLFRTLLPHWLLMASNAHKGGVEVFRRPSFSGILGVALEERLQDEENIAKQQAKYRVAVSCLFSATEFVKKYRKIFDTTSATFSWPLRQRNKSYTQLGVNACDDS